MKAIIISAMILAVVSGLTQFLLPWWGLAGIAFIAGAAFLKSPYQAFLACALGGALHWGLFAAWLDFQNNGILSGRVGDLFGGLPGMALIAITLVLGALIGGLGGLSGSLLKMSLVSKR